jgi:hypothetical protein
MNATIQKINLAREKSIEWIEYLATKSEEDLEKRLRVNHLQHEIAMNEGKEDVCELLTIMERIIIEARVYKEENGISDNPNEIDLAITEMDAAIIRSEDRQEIFVDRHEPVKSFVSKSIPSEENTDNNQLSLF